MSNDESGERTDQYPAENIPEMLEGALLLWLLCPMMLGMALLGDDLDTEQILVSVVGTSLWLLIIGAVVIDYV